MNLPLNGRVIVIDDKDEEGLPLLKALSKNKIPATYFNGDIDDLPENPFSDIKIAFLDIVLGTEDQPIKNKISTAIQVLEKIIDKKNNSPILIVAWTKHEDLIDELIKTLKREGFRFIFIDLEKNQCMKNKKYDLEIISKKLEQKLSKIEIVNLFFIWGNLVHTSAGKIVNDFSSFVDFDKDWNDKMFRVILKLAESYAGKQLEKKNSEEVVKNAFYSFNSTFLDMLESQIRSFCIPKINVDFEKMEEEVKIDVIGEINSRLLLIDEQEETNLPGHTYKDEPLDKRMMNNLIDMRMMHEKFKGENHIQGISKENFEKKYKEVFDTYHKKNWKELILEAIPVKMEISPTCDFAQKKMVVHRLVKGFLWPKDKSDILKKADYLYVSPIIKYNNHLYCLVFDFRYFTSVDIENLKDIKPIFRTRHEFLVDIQSKLAAHINRPGVVFVR